MPAKASPSGLIRAPRSVHRRQLLLAILLALAIGVVTADVLASGPLTRLDRSVARELGAEPTGWRYLRLYVLTLGGQRWLTIPLAMLIALWLVLTLRRLRPLLVLAAGWTALAVAGEILKTVTGRLAPHADHIALHAGGASYPSGHAANIVVTSGLLVYLTQAHPAGRRLRKRLVAGAVTISFITGTALILIGFHWVSDVLAGWLVGGLLLTSTALASQHRARSPGLGPPGRSARSGG